MSSKVSRKDRPSTPKPAKRKESVDGEVKGNEDSPKKRRKLSTGSTQSCHQCRQSILSNKGISELKAGKARRKCDTCTTYWCENCLENRYGLSFVEISGKQWSCPKCLKTCNCSICRKRAGMLATGILTPLAKDAGFSSVNDFLSKGTGAIAECLQWQEEKKSDSPSPKKSGKSPSKSRKSPGKENKVPSKGTKRRRASDSELPADSCEHESAPAAKRSKKRGASVETSRRHSFEVDVAPKKTPRRRTSLEEKRVSVEEYRRRMAERQEEIARQKQAEKDRKKQTQAADSARAKELKKQELEGNRQRKAEEKEKERRRSHELKEAALEEARRHKAEEKEEERRKSRELKQAAIEEARRLKAEGVEREKEAKKLEMERLRQERLATKQQKQEEHKKHVEEVRQQKAAERERELEEKKLELSRLREEKARARDQEREMKRLQLETLRAHVSQQKQVVKDLLSVNSARSRSKPNLSRTPSSTSSASSDSESGIDCDFLIPPVVEVDTIQDICIDVELPELPTWEIPVPLSQYHNLLLVSEFLTVFSSKLGLNGSYSAERLAETLLARTTLPGLHLALLKALLKAEAQEQEESEDDGFDEDEDDVGRVQLDQLPKLTASTCQQVLELYLAMAGYVPDPAFKGAGRRKMSADERTICDKLPVVAFLCERLIGMKFIAELVNETSEGLVELQKKHRVSEREVCKKINEELRAWTAEQLMARKDIKSIGEVSELPSASDRFSRQISEVRTQQQCEQDACASLVRGQLLGRDRTGRAFWFLQSVAGILVEEDTADSSNETQSSRGTKKHVNPFRICRSTDQLDKILDALCQDLPTEASLAHQLKLRSGALSTQDESC